MRKTFFDQTVKNDFRTYDNIRNTATGQGDDYTISCVLDYNYFNKYYKIIAIDLSKQQALDADPKAIQQIKIKKKLKYRKSSPRRKCKYNNVFHY